jgi:hypothetical protein
MTELYAGEHPNINFERLDLELRAALPDQTDGIHNDARNGDLWVVIREGVDPAPLAPQIEAVIAAHNPAVKTTAQLLRARRTVASTELSNADFKALWTAIENASSLSAIKPLMKALLTLQFKVAFAAGLTEAPNPEGT